MRFHCWLSLAAWSVSAWCVVAAQSLDPTVSIKRFREQLGPEVTLTAEQRDLITWGFAVQDWVLDAAHDAAAQLARGVLLECLASPAHATAGDLFPAMLLKSDRGACSYTTWSPPPHDGRDGFTVWTERVGGVGVKGCQKAAQGAYADVLAHDPGNTEATLRLGYLRALASSSDRADPLLSGLADTSGDPRYRYLALLFLGREAEDHGNLGVAAARYEQARSANDAWPSARLALASVLLQLGQLERARALASAGARPDPSDPWYGYACRIMTPAVATALRERQDRLNLR